MQLALPFVRIPEFVVQIGVAQSFLAAWIAVGGGGGEGGRRSHGSPLGWPGYVFLYKSRVASSILYAGVWNIVRRQV